MARGVRRSRPPGVETILIAAIVRCMVVIKSGEFRSHARRAIDRDSQVGTGSLAEGSLIASGASGLWLLPSQHPSYPAEPRGAPVPLLTLFTGRRLLVGRLVIAHKPLFSHRLLPNSHQLHWLADRARRKLSTALLPKETIPTLLRLGLLERLERTRVTSIVGLGRRCGVI